MSRQTPRVVFAVVAIVTVALASSRGIESSYFTYMGNGNGSGSCSSIAHRSSWVANDHRMHIFRPRSTHSPVRSLALALVMRYGLAYIVAGVPSGNSLATADTATITARVLFRELLQLKLIILFLQLLQIKVKLITRCRKLILPILM